MFVCVLVNHIHLQCIKNAHLFVLEEIFIIITSYYFILYYRQLINIFRNADETTQTYVFWLLGRNEYIWTVLQPHCG